MPKNKKTHSAIREIDPGRNKAKCFQGGKGAGAPQFWYDSFPLKRGRVFLAPPNIWSHEDLSPIRDICGISGVFRCFPVFSGVFRRFPAVSGGFRRFPAFCSKLATTAHEKSNFASMKKTTSSFY
jgi:hypothetical protein